MTSLSRVACLAEVLSARVGQPNRMISAARSRFQFRCVPVHNRSGRDARDETLTRDRRCCSALPTQTTARDNASPAIVRAVDVNEGILQHATLSRLLFPFH